MINARAFMHGVNVISVNPAYSSLIGHYNYARRYGLNTDQSAALVLARRAQGYSEEPISPQPHNDDHACLPVPVRKRGKHLGSFWREVSRKNKKWRMKRSIRNPADAPIEDPFVVTGLVGGSPDVDRCDARPLADTTVRSAVAHLSG